MKLVVSIKIMFFFYNDYMSHDNISRINVLRMLIKSKLNKQKKNSLLFDFSKFY